MFNLFALMMKLIFTVAKYLTYFLPVLLTINIFSHFAIVLTLERGHIGPCICRRIPLLAKLNGTISGLSSKYHHLHMCTQSSGLRNSSKYSLAQETAST